MLKDILALNDKLNNKSPLVIAFLASLLFAFIVYGFELTHFTLSIDEAIGPQHDYTFFISIGRWMYVFLKAYIFPKPYVPFFTTFISFIFLALTSVIIVKTFHFTASQAFVFSACFIGLPQFAYQLEFTTQSDVVALGLLCLAISFYYFNKRTKANAFLCYLLMIVTTTLATAIYQSLLFVPFTLYLAKLIIDLEKQPAAYKKILAESLLFIGLMIISAIAYFTLSKLINYLNEITINTYLNNFKLQHETTIAALISLVQCFTEKLSYGLDPYFLAYIPVIWSGLQIFQKYNFKQFIIFAVSLLLFISPFFICIALRMPQPARVLMSLPMAMGLLWGIFMQQVPSRHFMVPLSILLVLIGSANANRLFYSDYAVHEADKALANRIYSSIQSKYPFFSPTKTAVYVRTPYYYDNFWKLPHSETFGASHFNWDGEQSAGRVQQLFRVLSMANLHMPDEATIQNLDQLCLPSWPNKESIQLIDEVLVVNLRRDLVRKPDQICNVP